MCVMHIILITKNCHDVHRVLQSIDDGERWRLELVLTGLIMKICKDEEQIFETCMKKLNLLKIKRTCFN